MIVSTAVDLNGAARDNDHTHVSYVRQEYPPVPRRASDCHASVCIYDSNIGAHARLAEYEGFAMA